MKWTRNILFVFTAGLFYCCNAQTQKENSNTIEKNNRKNTIVGGGCDGCELMYAGMPSTIDAIDTSAAWNEQGKKILIRGVVYNFDGKTPAPDVAIYYWQTDNTGYYVKKEGLHSNASLHGYVRGWVKTNIAGEYFIYTIKPAPYPNAQEPAHIHYSIKEPKINNEYYIDDVMFDDDTFLTTDRRKYLEKRGGSGIVILKQDKNYLIGERNIILGMNIPDYTK